MEEITLIKAEQLRNILECINSLKLQINQLETIVRKSRLDLLKEKEEKWKN